jgi:hypothetical protein
VLCDAIRMLLEPFTGSSFDEVVPVALQVVERHA